MAQENMQRSRNSIERVILIIYSVYTIAMSVVTIMLSWGQWVAPLILVGMVVCWAAYLKKAKDYRYRAFLTASLCWVNFILYGIHSESYFIILSTMSGLVILLGIYCIPEIVYISAGGSTFLLLYHGLLLQDIYASSWEEAFLTILRICSVYLTEYVTYYMIKTQLATNQRLLDNIDALHSVERSKDDFMANVSHEIRTPINTVCGMSEMLLREELAPGVRGEVFDIQTAGRNLLSIVSDILDFSELESGKMDLVEEPYNITSTVNDVMNMTNAQLVGKNIELIVCCDANIPSGLLGDEQKIRRVIMNLVNNAVKFTNEGCVTITLSARKEQYGINLIVSIKDTGIGMSEIELEKLFSSFNQVDTKRNRQEGGIGLGLAISQAIVRKMGGFITVKSMTGQGSEFQFVVPQKVVENTPIISVRDVEGVNVLAYVNMEKFTYAAVRDGYEACIDGMVQQMGFQLKRCRNLAELKRRLETIKCTHVIICWEEYCEDKAWFDQLAEQLPVVLVLDRQYDTEVSGKLLRIYKPFYAVAFAAILNGEYTAHSAAEDGPQGSRFIAPEASILAVDDNMMNLKVLEGLLRPYQIKVFAAYSGKEALKKIESMDFDFVFMDHMMPEMDGVETMHRIRQKPGRYFQTVPIIALTANAIGGAREMFLNEGFQDFVAKPIELSVMERVLLKYIPENKIVRVTKEQARTAAAERSVKQQKKQENPEGFEGYQDINVRQGIAYCGGNIRDYLDVVQIYYTTGMKKKDEIQKYYESKDWNNYAILVHAVKSTSQGIGAAALSDMAKDLEKAGKAGNESFIQDHHQAMMDEYKRVLGVLGADERISSDASQAAEGELEAVAAPALGESTNESMTETAEEELKELLDELKEKLDTFESDEVDALLEKWQNHQYQGTPLSELFEPIRKKAAVFDFIGAEEELAGIRERLV